MNVDFAKLLNSRQLEAVAAPPGNILVLAGAGSGKTRVLVYRVAWLIAEQQAMPQSILTVTFTNKAAKEMRARFTDLLQDNAKGMWIGTFHGLAHKLLRFHWAEANLPQNFQVIDSGEQLQIIKKLQKQLEINPDRFDPKKLQHFISSSKDEGIRPSMLGAADNPFERIKFEFYGHYESYCKQQGLVDFSELLLLCYETLRDNHDLALHYQARFKHVLVDEFQDTNNIQYQWFQLMAKSALSTMVVGDDDQSIYGWRGAKVENIYKFLSDFAGTSKICLEQNYRSTGIILEAANAVIKNNSGRLGKNLWTETTGGDPISLYTAFNEQDEARYVVQEIKNWVTNGGRLQDIGILYRSNAQSRVIEDALVRSGVTYTIYGGLRFFERAEIKDALAYLRLLVNCHDDVAFERVINAPPRGIGAKSFQKIKDLTMLRQCSYWDAAQYAIVENLLTGKAKAGFISFMRMFELFTANNESIDLLVAVEFAVNDSGLLNYFREQKGDKAQSRAENLAELVSATSVFMQETTSDVDVTINLTDFLAYSALEGTQTVDDPEQPAVQLMTVHSAKGLEFKLVFICGVEESLFPHHFSREGNALEEERRLCYVAMTRAMQKLILTSARYRRLFGKDELRNKSRFISEIPAELLDEQQQMTVTQPSYYMQHTAMEQVPFPIGSRVTHAQFGAGTVINSEGMDERARVQVQFDGCGSKWLLAEYAKLEQIA
ncbi:MAG: DNA helicase II [Legionellales bacterium]|nr:MAG: DNA helicase II [Legionellales bacterium]